MGVTVHTPPDQISATGPWPGGATASLGGLGAGKAARSQAAREGPQAVPVRICPWEHGINPHTACPARGVRDRRPWGGGARGPGAREADSCGWGRHRKGASEIPSFPSTSHPQPFSGPYTWESNRQRGGRASWPGSALIITRDLRLCDADTPVLGAPPPCSCWPSQTPPTHRLPARSLGTCGGGTGIIPTF